MYKKKSPFYIHLIFGGGGIDVRGMCQSWGSRNMKYVLAHTVLL
jgi:hypothetical protein